MQINLKNFISITISSLVLTFLLIQIYPKYSKGILNQKGSSIDWTLGWDFYLTCTNERINSLGIDNYYKSNVDKYFEKYQNSENFLGSMISKSLFDAFGNTGMSITYPPYIMKIIQPFCRIIKYDYSKYLFYIFIPITILMTLLITFSSLKQITFLDYFIKTIFILGSFSGLSGVLLSGNVEGLCLPFFALSLLLFYQSFRKENFFLLILGCFFFGFFISLKFNFLPIVVCLIFLPLTFRNKIYCFAFCLLGMVSTLVYSLFFQGQLLHSYYLLMTGQLDQVLKPQNLSFLDNNVELCLHSMNNLFCLFHFYAKKIFSNFKSTFGLWIFILYFVLGISTSFLILYKILKIVPFEKEKSKIGFQGIVNWLINLNNFLIQNKKFAIYIFILSIYTIYIFLPRMPIYYFWGLSILGALLLIELKLQNKIIVLLFSIVVPYFFV